LALPADRHRVAGRALRLAPAALLAILAAGCAAHAHPGRLAPATRHLAAEIDSALSGPEFDRALWGVVVQSLDNGEVVYRRNAERLLMPASNMKLLTSSAALVRLGADFRYRTVVLARGTRRGDTLAGDLVVVGRGDPTFSQHASGGADVLASLRPWADSLRARGVRTVAGRVAGDGSWFTDPPLGRGWAWDDLADSYAAGVGALQFNEGFALLQVAPGDSAGAAAPATLLPTGAPLRLFGTVTTVPRDSNVERVEFDRAPFTDSVTVSGRISAGRAPARIEIAVPDPVRYFEAALTQVLREAGIAVLGQATPAATGAQLPAEAPRASPPGASPAAGAAAPAESLRAAAPPFPVAPADTLFVWQSPPLRDIVPLFLKPSQNQIGETLLRTLGGAVKGAASVDSGRATVREVLREFGVADDAYVIADGSGLSRYDYVAPETLARVLLAMARRSDFDVFYRALPIAGVDGTIAGRMRGTAAANNVHAKTGSIANVRSLSGYVTSADGERFVFVMIANHFTAPRRVVEVVQDHVMERLANFRRHPDRPR
jgi:D-alanyl-D-alanine carboxypeptidase/D-alanyl-D-alanine-endopeptidase (penicillin-binding protein 4)